MKKVNWAVMGPGRITEEFIPALLYVENAHPYAVASRSIDRAKATQVRYGFEKAYGSYEELVQDKQIDVIYIATPTACHFENAKLCLENGQNVLCEKCVTRTVEEFNELVEIAKANDVFFMEGSENAACILHFGFFQGGKDWLAILLRLGNQLRQFHGMGLHYSLS